MPPKFAPFFKIKIRNPYAILYLNERKGVIVPETWGPSITGDWFGFKRIEFRLIEKLYEIYLKMSYFVGLQFILI